MYAYSNATKKSTNEVFVMQVAESELLRCIGLFDIDVKSKIKILMRVAKILLKT